MNGEEEIFIKKCFRVACNNPAHEYSRYCLEHLKNRNKSPRQLQWEEENAEAIKEDLKKMKERKKEQGSRYINGVDGTVYGTKEKDDEDETR